MRWLEIYLGVSLLEKILMDGFRIINPFINATLNVLETMAFVKSEAGKPYLKKDNVARGDVSGINGNK
ncbi:MAG: hypothetical protein SRB2_02816 [Desulfobacteraceae bacterium Eth-SRB2]|nr:MAG: hypothetical protein SRB2_02816 [Desulfobacteraceae bacterium Eth-SRB2]